MEYVRTNGKDYAFIDNCKALNAFLDKRIGKEVQKNMYDSLNGLEDIENVIVVYDCGNVIGAGGFKKFNEQEAEIKRVFIHPENRSKGIGRELIAELCVWMRELGYTKAILETGKALQEAQHLYLQSGFHIIENYGSYQNKVGSICIEKIL